MSRDTARKVLEIESEAIRELIPRLDESFDRAVEALRSCPGRVVVTGMGKSGLIGQKISATLASTGTPSLFLHPAEATHGDLGRLVKGDVLLALSNSGDTGELLALAAWARRLGSPIVALTGNPDSALAMGDALSMTLLEERGFTVEDFAVLHPGGRIGKRFLRVEDLMHTGDAIPSVRPDTMMKDVLFEMTRKRLGLTTVTEEDGTLAGMISDGDLRRLMEGHGYSLLDRAATDCMTREPVLVGRRELATGALDLLESRKITSLLVVDEKGRIEGVLHLHDLWKTEMI